MITIPPFPFTSMTTQRVAKEHSPIPIEIPGVRPTEVGTASHIHLSYFRKLGDFFKKLPEFFKINPSNFSIAKTKVFIMQTMY